MICSTFANLKLISPITPDSYTEQLNVNHQQYMKALITIYQHHPFKVSTLYRYIAFSSITLHLRQQDQKYLEQSIGRIAIPPPFLSQTLFNSLRNCLLSCIFPSSKRCSYNIPLDIALLAPSISPFALCAIATYL